MKKSLSTLILFCLYVSISFAQVKSVECIGITVSDMDRALSFYSNVLGFEKVSEEELFGEPYETLNNLFGLRMRIVKMKLGEESIELIDYLTAGGRSIPENAKSNDLSFQHIAIVVSDMDAAYAHLRKFNVEQVSTAPQTIPATNTAAAGIRAFYFHDPDRHNLELIYFPKGKGQQKWQTTNGKLFLGIDHTAIGIRSTSVSAKFYEEILGIERKGDSWNKGMEQEHLNNVEGASLHITGYRAAAGPGIEFLQYLNPGPGKSYPANSGANDIWHWQTLLIVDDATSLYNRLMSEGYKFVSKELVHQHSDGIHTISFIIRDPDGHAMLIKEYVSK